MATATENGNTSVTPVFKAAGFRSGLNKDHQASRCVLPSSRDRNSYLSCVASPILRTDNSHTRCAHRTETRRSQRSDGTIQNLQACSLVQSVLEGHTRLSLVGGAWFPFGIQYRIFGRSWGARDCLCELFQFLISSSGSPFRIR
jgi:hypothetical protein